MVVLLLKEQTVEQVANKTSPPKQYSVVQAQLGQDKYPKKVTRQMRKHKTVSPNYRRLSTSTIVFVRRKDFKGNDAQVERCL